MWIKTMIYSLPMTGHGKHIPPIKKMVRKLGDGANVYGILFDPRPAYVVPSLANTEVFGFGE